MPDQTPPAPDAPSPGRSRPPAWLRWAVVPASVGLATAAAFALDGVVPEGAVGMLYLAAVVASSVAAGPGPALLAALLSFLGWNFLFLSPRYELNIASAQDLFGVAIFSLVALLLVGATGGLDHSVRAARARLFSLQRLMETSRRLGVPGSVNDLVTTVAEEARRVTGRPACVLMPLPDPPPGAAPELVLRASQPIEAEPGEAALAAVGEAFAPGSEEGTLAVAGWEFRPMRTARGVVGVVGVALPPGGWLPPERQGALHALLDQAAVAIERAELMAERARGAARAETEALRTALLTSLGHDLRTPLTAIRGAAETLRDNAARLPEATRADLLTTVIEEAARMGRFLANILDMVRVESGEITPRREPVDLAEALEHAAERAEAGSGRVVARALPERLPQPRLDPALLDQVLGNLLDNALKFSGPAGEVRVGARTEGAEVALFVEDDGPGVARAELPRIFDPFFRASRADRIAAGSGLGLAICRGLVAAMGGRIGAESPVRAGRGTRITLRFPA